MNKKSQRYLLTPQMMEYDRMQSVVYPFLMFFQPPCYSSGVVNTDSRGFRVTYDHFKNICNLNDACSDGLSIIVGGSVVFGDGATNDFNTISSVLCAETGNRWLNFGGRAFNSTQELRLFEFNRHLVKGVKKIVIFSGVNNLISYYLSNNYSKEYGHIFYWNIFKAAADELLEIKLSTKRKLMKAMLYPIYGNGIDYINVSLNDLAGFLSGKKELARTKNALKLSKIDKNVDSEKDDVLFVLKRDLNMWKIIAEALHIDIYYALQPMANWVKKELSIEEKRLFAELDVDKRSVGNLLSVKLGDDVYNWYKHSIKRLCQENGIKYFDMNEYLSSINLNRKWVFVDRLHLTDEGNNIIAKAFIKEGIC